LPCPFNTFFTKILGKQTKKGFEYNLSGHGEEADVEAGQSHLQAYQVIWNTRKLIGKRASDMESDIRKKVDGKTDRQTDRSCGTGEK
jgi:hypothetical protein